MGEYYHYMFSVENVTLTLIHRASDYLSLTSEINGYVFENGRRYHGYKPGRA
jgi:hypothetical protein